MNAIQIFHQLHLEYLIVSSLRSLDVLFLKNFHGWNRNRDSFVKQRAFCCFMGFWVFLSQFQKKCSCFSKIAHWIYLDQSLISFLNHFMQGSSSKIVRKLSKTLKKIENSQFFQHLGHSGENFDHRSGNFFENVLQA